MQLAFRLNFEQYPKIHTSENKKKQFIDLCLVYKKLIISFSNILFNLCAENTVMRRHPRNNL